MSVACQTLVLASGAPERGLGVTESLADALPAIVREFFAVLTHGADAPVLFGALLFVALTRDHSRGVVALGILLGGFGLFLSLKNLFGLPRPPATIQVVAEAGKGFPSAHAFDATVGFGLLAILLERGTPRQRFTLAGVGVMVIAFSRLAIGVHYLVDVVAGVVIGVGFLWGALRLVDWQPDRAAGLAGVFGSIALVTGDERALLVLLGAAGVALAGRIVTTEEQTSGL